MSVVIDPQAAGVVDDGTDEGSIRARIATGDLVMVPFMDGSFSVSDIAGTSSASFNGGSVPGNSDGSGSGLFVVVPQGSSVSPQGVKVTWVVYGTVVGIRWARGTSPDFAVEIDGVGYTTANALRYNEADTALTGGVDPSCFQVIATDLTDGPHIVALVFPYSTAGQSTWTIYGYLAERRAGYAEPVRLCGFYNNDAPYLAATQTRVIPSSSVMRGVRKVLYHNTDGSTRTVTVQLSGNTIRLISLAAGTSGELDLGEVVAVQRATSGTGSFTHAADMASTIRVAVVVGL